MAGAVLVVAALTWVAPGGYAAAQLSPVNPPANPEAPVAPGAAVPACSFTPLGATEIRPIAFDWTADGVVGGGGSAGALPPWQFPAVDPRDPCRIFGTSQWTDVGRLDHGSWTTVLQRSSTALLRKLWSPPAVTADGTVLEGATSDFVPVAATPQSIFLSHDEGRTWLEADTGIPAGLAVTSITTASTDPNEAFALAWPPGFERTDEPVLFVTHDGASTWSPAPVVLDAGSPAFSVPLLPSTPPMVAVDPVANNEVFLLASIPSAGGNALSVSSDGGRTWPTTHPLAAPAGTAPCGLIAGHPEGTAVAYVKLCSGKGDIWLRTDDDGASFSQLTVPQAQSSVITVDGRDHHTLLWATPVVAADGRHWTGTHLIASSDEFHSSLVDTVVANPADWQTPPPWLVYPGPPGPEIDPNPPVLLQSDSHGNFFMYVSDFQDAPVSPNTADADHIVAFRLTALMPAPIGSQTGTAQGGSQSSPGGGWNGGSGVDPSATMVRDLRTCALPQPPLPQAAVASSYTSGSVSFDGDYLDYTYIDPQGAPGIAGVIYRLFSDCSPAPPLHLNAGDFPHGVLPEIDWLAYDPVLRLPGGAEGALLISTGGAGHTTVGAGVVYAVSPVTGRAWPRFQGGALYSYDAGQDALWEADESGLFGLEDLTGQKLPSCLDGSPLNNASVVSSIVYARPGVIYIQSEDNVTVDRVDTSDCHVTGGFTHRPYSESSGENDQMACDPVTFGNGSSGFSVLWIKDVGPNTVTAYQIPDGYCPFPTALQYNGDTRANAGSGLELCATLTAQRAGRRVELPDKLVSFSLNGRIQGSDTTDAHGHACVPGKAPGQDGSYPVHAAFAGDRAYAPSDATASMLSVGAISPPVVLGFIAPAGGSVVSGAGGTAPQSSVSSQLEPAAQSQAQSQAQAQAQAQVQSQSQAQGGTQLQPAVMPQKQRRTQLATQEQPTSTAYEATALRRHQPAPWVPATVGMLMFGVGLLVRRPRCRVAPARHGGDGTLRPRRR